MAGSLFLNFYWSVRFDFFRDTHFNNFRYVSLFHFSGFCIKHLKMTSFISCRVKVIYHFLLCPCFTFNFVSISFYLFVHLFIMCMCVCQRELTV